MKKDKLREKLMRSGPPWKFLTQFEELSIPLGYKPKKGDIFSFEMGYKILQKKNPIKQKRDFDLALFEILPMTSMGILRGEFILDNLKTVLGPHINRDYERIRNLANEEMQKQFKSAKKHPEKILYKFISENPWNLREHWVIKTILDWQQSNFQGEKSIEREAYRKKLEGLGKCFVVRTGKGRGIGRRIKHSFRYPRFWIDRHFLEIKFLFTDLQNLICEMSKLRDKIAKRQYLETMLDVNNRWEKACSTLFNKVQVKQKIEEYADEIKYTLQDGKPGQIRELILRILSKITRMKVGTLKKNLFERDRAVEFEIRVLVNKKILQISKI